MTLCRVSPLSKRNCVPALCCHEWCVLRRSSRRTRLSMRRRPASAPKSSPVKSLPRQALCHNTGELNVPSGDSLGGRSTTMTGAVGPGVGGSFQRSMSNWRSTTSSDPISRAGDGLRRPLGERTGRRRTGLDLRGDLALERRPRSGNKTAPVRTRQASVLLAARPRPAIPRSTGAARRPVVRESGRQRYREDRTVRRHRAGSRPPVPAALAGRRAPEGSRWCEQQRARRIAPMPTRGRSRTRGSVCRGRPDSSIWSDRRLSVR